MANAIEYGLVVALVAVVIVTGVSTALNGFHKAKHEVTQPEPLNPFATVYRRAANDTAQQTLKLGAVYKDKSAGKNLAVTGIITKTPTQTACGEIVIDLDQNLSNDLPTPNLRGSAIYPLCPADKTAIPAAQTLG